MTTAERVYDILTKNDLEQLKTLALREHDEFFERNPHLKSAFHDSLIGICLCQGAALHYLDSKVATKGFDIWHFYVKHETINFPDQAHKRIENGYKDRNIEFLKRAISRHIHASHYNEPDMIILQYLLERDTYTKNSLLKKPIIGLFPDDIFGKIIWKG